MKKLIALGIAIVVVLAMSVTAEALSDSKPIGITLNITDVFELEVLDDGDLDTLLELGLLDEGATSGGNLLCTAKTNQGNAWTLQIQGEDLTNAGATQSITVDNIKFKTYSGGGSPGVGTYVTAFTPVTTADQPAYTADVSEYSDTWVTVMMGLEVFVPYGTISDYYGGDLTITMVE